MTWMSFKSWSEERTQEKIVRTQAQMILMCDKIEADLTPDGNLIWPPACDLSDKDLWGSAYVFEYDKEKPKQFLVGSPGPDKKWGTPDDIFEQGKVKGVFEKLREKAVEKLFN